MRKQLLFTLSIEFLFVHAHGTVVEFRRMRVYKPDLAKAMRSPYSTPPTISGTLDDSELIRTSKCFEYCERVHSVPDNVWNALWIYVEDSVWKCQCSYTDPHYPTHMAEEKAQTEPENVYDVYYIPGSLAIWFQPKVETSLKSEI